MNGQIIAGINRKTIGQIKLQYNWNRFDFPEGGEKKIKNFPISEYVGFNRFLKPLIFVKDGKIFLKQGITRAKWDKEALKASQEDSKIQNDLVIAANARNKRIAEDARKKNEQIRAEGIACRSQQDYEKAVDKPKRDGLHRINKLNPALIAARSAFLALLRLNVLGFASVLNLKFAKEWGKWKNQSCRAYNTEWAKKGRESKVSPPALERIQRILYNLGFEPNSVVNPNKPFSKAVGAGANKKAVGKDLLKLIPGKGKYEKTLNDTIAWYKADGRDIGFVSGTRIGEPATTAALITAGSAIIMKLMPFLLKIPGVSDQVSSECGIQEEEIDKIKEVNKVIENDIMTLQGEQGIGQVPSLEELGLPPKLDFIENESSESKITRATDLYDSAQNLYNSFKSTFSAIKESACTDINLRYQTELNKFEILQKELKRLSGKGSILGGDMGKFLPYIIGGAALYFLMAKRKK
mgnify:CR=1 FL=1